MKIAFFETEEWEEEYLRERLKGNELLFFEDELSKKLLPTIKDVDIISVFIYSKVTSKLLKEFEHLQAVITRSTGFDHIDWKYAKKNNISVLNVPTYGENTVAEHTFALILALSRKIHLSYERTVRGNFSLERLQGFDLQGKTIGIIGLGNIGIHVARIAKGFGMNILAHTPKKDTKIAKQLGIQYTNLPTLLEESDIISFHCPLTKQTKHLLNSKNIGLLKPTCMVVNTSRGGVIQTKALVKALINKKIGAAALDVLEEESLIREEAQLLSKRFPKEHLENLLENHLLLTFENVIITPHNAFNSKEALTRILETTIENVHHLCNGKHKGNCVW